MRRLVLLSFVAVAALGAGATARASAGDEQALAKRYAPVVRLVEQKEECGPGEPYEPIDVNALFGAADRRAPRTVERGRPGQDRRRPRATSPAASTATTSTSPGTRSTRAAATSAGRGASPRATSRRCTRTSPPSPAHPGKLALQYWFFYVFNDWNNLHEGDWEMIQLDFDAATRERGAREATRRGRLQPARGRRAGGLGRRQARRSSTAPTRSSTRRPARTRTSTTRRCYLGSSAEQGVGCDDTTRPARRPAPGGRDDPERPGRRRARAYPWIDFQGRWGELQQAFYNGPTGPNLKTQWTRADHAGRRAGATRATRSRPAALFGTAATDFFCGAIGSGLEGARPARRPPAASSRSCSRCSRCCSLFALSRTSWRPSAPLRLARRRAWGQTLVGLGAHVRRERRASCSGSGSCSSRSRS